MRRVEFIEMKFVPYNNKTGVGSHFEKLDPVEATFHEFGCDYEEFENGSGNFSTAIVEKDDGTVKNVPVERIRFLKSAPPYDSTAHLPRIKG